MSVAMIEDAGMTPLRTTLDELHEQWGFSTRTFNVLKREGVTTLDRLTFLTEDQLWEMRNLGGRGVEEILTKMHEHGYKLAGYTPFRTIYGVPGLKDGYQASRDGQIMSPSGHVLKTHDKKGSPWINVARWDTNGVLPVDVMVLSAYDRYLDHEPIHKDGDLGNCNLDNLAWSDQLVKKRMGRPRKKMVISRTEAPLTPKARDTVEVYRTYVSDEVTASISDDGSGSVNVGGTTLSLTAPQIYSLTKVMARIGEMNALMGIG